MKGMNCTPSMAKEDMLPQRHSVRIGDPEVSRQAIGDKKNECLVFCVVPAVESPI